MNKSLVLGANGFIGKSLCAVLTKKCAVRAFDRCDCGSLFKLGVQEFIEDDFLNLGSFDSLLDGVDTVYHLISTTLPKESTTCIVEEEINQNLVPTLRLLESMKRVGTKTIVFASSGGTIYGDYSGHANKEADPLKPKCSYGLQKQLVEDCLNFYSRTCGIKARIMRISNPYGIGQQANRMQGVIPIFIDRLMKGLPITLYGAESQRDYIFMDDVIEALVRAGEYEGDVSTFNIASGEVYTLSEIVEIIEDTVGRKYREITYKEQRPFDVNHTIIDTTLAAEELDWTAKVSIRQGVEALYAQMQNFAVH